MWVLMSQESWGTEAASAWVQQSPWRPMCSRQDPSEGPTCRAQTAVLWGEAWICTVNSEWLGPGEYTRNIFLCLRRTWEWKR